MPFSTAPPERPLASPGPKARLSRRAAPEDETDPEQTEAAWTAPPLLLLIVSLIPFWLLPLSHLASSPMTATGFYHEELPYYMANGRAAFERGNGFLYANPYDPDRAAPAIYGHWLLWGLGLPAARLNLDPGDVLMAATFFGSLAFAAMTWKLVGLRSVAGSSALAYLFAMWGGGLLASAGFAASLLGVTDPISSLLQFDPGKGLWFLNWGRNAVFATEAVYHVLVAGCWCCEMRGRRLRGTLWCAALATTHPWSGLELLLTLNLWRTVQLATRRDRAAWCFSVLAGIMLVAFLGYYRIWLPCFEHHRRLQDVWELDWSLSWFSAALAYTPVLIPAAARLLAALPGASEVGPESAPDSPTGKMPALSATVAHPLTAAEQFLVCALIVATGLVFHDRVMKPVQPLHFTRGYIWMPLFLIGLPTLQTLWQKISARSLTLRVPALGLFLLLLTDNGVFAVVHSQWLWLGQRGYHLTVDDRAVLRELHQRFPGAVVLTESEVLNYLLPTFANIRPWIWHPFNTPEIERRRTAMARVFRGDTVDPEAIPAEVDLLLVQSSRNVRPLVESGRWVALNGGNATWSVWGQAAD